MDSIGYASPSIPPHQQLRLQLHLRLQLQQSFILCEKSMASHKIFDGSNIHISVNLLLVIDWSGRLHQLVQGIQLIHNNSGDLRPWIRLWVVLFIIGNGFRIVHAFDRLIGWATPALNVEVLLGE